MSEPSTPQRATRPSASPSSSPEQNAEQDASPQILTPGRKIKAMMAAFEDDSDSETENGNRNEGSARKLESESRGPSAGAGTRGESLNAGFGGNGGDREDLDAGEDEEEEDIVRPRGRMAARMQADSGSDQRNGSGGGEGEGETAFERVSRMLHQEEQEKVNGSSAGNDGEEKGQSDDDDEDDDLPIAGRRRRPAGPQDEVESPVRERSFSPLFMSSPTASRHDNQQDGGDDNEGEASAEDDDAPRSRGNPRFQALVAQKRKEREEKERVEAEKKAARRKQQMEQFSSEILSGDGDSGDDDTSARKLTQQSRPARKASKKAVEEMHRETQRISRNMQLTHQMQTKKKITKESLFARFNFMQPQQEQPAGRNVETSSTADSQPSSDPSAPEKDATNDGGDKQAQTTADSKAGDLPTLDQLISDTQEHANQPIVGEAETEAKVPDSQPVKATTERKPLTAAPVRVRLSRQSVAQTQQDDSDDDLDVVTSPSKCRRIALFENLPTKKTQENAAMVKLKALAHLTSPSRKATMNNAELSALLRYKARQQAAKEREERIQELRDKGLVIETAEERAAMEDTVEDLVERARKEGEDIARQERDAAKKQEQPDEEEDADYELSGSDEEGYGDDEDEDHEGQDAEGEGFVENEAGEADESEDGETDASENETEAPSRRKRPTRVISDDEDEDEDKQPEPRTPARQTTQTVGSVERPQFPELPGSNGLTMSLTQAFAGTLGDNEVGSQLGSTIPDSLPDPGRSAAGDQEGDSQVMVKDSQEQRPDPPDLLAGYTPSDARVSESPAHPATSQVPEPTQDAGFVLSPFDPSKRFMGTPTSTVETVLLSQNQQHHSPIKKGRLLKRGQAPQLSAVEEEKEDEGQEGDFEINASAFNVMKKATKKTTVPFDRKNSKAKEVVEDAAEESDDEYAGLGGASDESDEEENVYDQQMINDNSGETVDEKQLAALNADHHRAADEKQVAKLLKDITSGALRRRRGGGDDFDLDDSDDERLARRREKQREFARMRKALLADEKVGELADNPKKAAFFKAIEDHNSDDDMDLEFLDEKDSGSQEDTSSQDVASQAQDNSNTSETNKRKRPLEPSAEDVNNRPPPHLRRKPASAMSKKPASLAEIRETLSFLTETPEYDSFREDASIEEDHTVEPDQGETPEEHSPETQTNETDFPMPSTNPRRTRPRGPVVDRLALLRQASSNSANSTSSSTSRLAFHTGLDMKSDIGFRPPSFAKRASVSSSSSSSALSSSSDNSRRVSKPGAASGTNVSKKGAVNYYTAAREKEREKELRLKQRSRGANIAALLSKHTENKLGALGGGHWE
ncbi:hypothetical protein PHISCL_08146 [Aspergillus sclerotialis]|uniref:DNA replication checkpoint mediator MRC1 domain-containing protein n=1 Tax=Aspergillus sclerotialis TaxID=2070753 RepID=A0A3A2Z8S3_9EURO|nr:hypothetical protein PHISCL_08146 [Aspergillus sclerotialis]